MAMDMSRFINRFVEEARDLVSQLRSRLGQLEGNPTDRENLDATFRFAHTLKGSSRMLKLVAISDTAHALEEVLDGVRAGKVAVTPSLCQTLYLGVDGLAGLVEMVATGGELPAADSTLITALTQACTPSAALPLPPVEAAVSPVVSGEKRTQKAPDTIRINLAKLDDMINLMGGIIAGHKRLKHRAGEIGQLSRQSRERSVPTGDWQEHVESLQEISTHLRDTILDLDQLITQLGEKTLLMRMLPLATLFDSSAWLVRDLARSIGKEVVCQVQGGEIELDRRVIDILSDPLIHLLRNAVDHGLETPQERLAKGKVAQGTIRLSAHQEGNSVVVEVEDDGRGLDLERIKGKAVQKGLIDANQGMALTEEQTAELIFLPGLSTSPLITDMSGRGVGMDVVKRKVEDELRGDIRLSRPSGGGILFQLRFPLSLAIMRILLCRSGGLQVGIAALHIRELIRLSPAMVMHIANQPVVKVVNEFIPLARLSDLLGLATAGGENFSSLVVLVRAEQHQLALMVDELLDEQDMVVKPLPEHLRSLDLVNGLVITGADELVAVLHVPGLMDKARAKRGDLLLASQKTGVQRGFRILVVDDSLSTREIEREVLLSHGYQVTLAEDGLDGWQKAMAGSFDAIITDVEMPGLDGFSLTSRLRQEEKYRHTPVVILTSRAREEDRQRGIQVGADAYIVKGDFDQGSLINTLHNLLA